MKKRYLTKSRFKLALECPTKLFYTGKKAYRDSMAENKFLEMLAEGGYQVGALAKLAFPGGIEVEGLDPDAAVLQTEKLLQVENVTLFEPAIRVGNFLVRIDVLVKKGNRFDLIEVKAKSYNTLRPNIESKDGGISSAMLPYIQDVAFQTWVLRQAFPGAEVVSYLMMPDKSKVAQVDGMNQMFPIIRNGRSVTVEPNIGEEVDWKAILQEILAKVPVNDYVSKVLNNPIGYPGGEGYLSDVAREWSNAYANDQKIPPKIGSQCGSCQFRTEQEDDKRSGFVECWKEAAGISDVPLESTVLGLWNFRKKQDLIERGTYLLSEMEREDLGSFESSIGNEGLTRQQRQWMQIVRAKPEEISEDFYIDRRLIAAEMSNWRYPLHFIDFETSTVALPFYKGMRPYESVAFQFSHHQMTESGDIAHVGECLLAEPGQFPNFEFVRQLKAQLEDDEGTVFMWSHHENTILTSIARQLEEEIYPPADANDLIDFLDSLTKGGAREMIDLCKISEKAFFHPDTHGSNSIKKVLPAVLKISKRLRALYSKPLYGSPNGIESKNFSSVDGFIWLDEKVCDPYVKLKSLAKDLLPENSSEDSLIADGGGAATAYSRLQFEMLSAEERCQIESALLRYCELDTLAMAMVVQAWKELCF